MWSSRKKSIEARRTEPRGRRQKRFQVEGQEANAWKYSGPMSSDWSRFYILSVCMHLHVLLSLQDATQSKQQDKSIWTTFHVVRAFQDQAVAAVFGLTSLWSYFRLLPQLLFMRACLEHASMWDDTAGQRYISWPWHASALVNCWGRWTPKLTTRLVLSLDGHLPDMWIFCLCLQTSRRQLFLLEAFTPSANAKDANVYWNLFV